jgi:hypothetical protein
MALTYTDHEAATSLVDVIGECRWDVVSLAHGYLAMQSGASDEEAARVVFKRGPQSLKRSRELIRLSRDAGFLSLLTQRSRTGSAENPITKLFPATMTEERFLAEIEELREHRAGLEYEDDRKSGHTLTDFTLIEGELRLPINVKNAGTRFLNARQLVGLAPEDCIPIPAYKAHSAVSVAPSLIYVVSPDYDLVRNLNAMLPSLMDSKQTIVWDLLTRYEGSHLRSAEDAFVFGIVRLHFDALKTCSGNGPFHVISARKAIRTLQTKPERTPGIGLRAWGTGASAEVNVHVSIAADMKTWAEIANRIASQGIINVIEAESEAC